MNKTSSGKRLIRRVILDIFLTCIALVVFALFHHVLPRQLTAVGTVIENPYKRPAATVSSDTSGALPEDTILLADSGTVVSDVGYRSSSRRSRGSQRENNRGTQSSSKGGSALDSTDAQAESILEDDTPIWEKFSDKYTQTTVITDTTYTSPDISITVSKQTLNSGDITYYLADIYLRDVTCLQSVLAGSQYGTGFRDSIENMSLLSHALLAINGDYYGNTQEGVVIRNGVVYRANPTQCDVCVLYYDGSMRVIPGSSFSLEEAIADGAWQAWTFGPSLLGADGSALTAFSSTGRIIAANPRTAIGYYEKGHYCMVVVDGRGDSAGITLPQLSELFYSLGCTQAYNLDGGNSSIMVWQQDTINQPSGGGRESSDALVIAEVTEYGQT